MGILLHKVPKYHKELFGDDRPRSLYLIIMAVFDFWEMHPLRPEFTTLFNSLSAEKSKEFKDKYVKEVPLEGLENIAPAWHFQPGIHRSWQLIKYLPRDGEIKVPLTIFFGKGLKKNQWEKGRVYEGSHRAGAASALGWKTVPALVLDTVGIARDGYCGMSDEDRMEMRKKQEEMGLQNTSRIHGVQIHLWSEKELRQFMFPRPKDRTKYGMQDLHTSKCKEGHPGWDGIKEGSVEIKIRAGNFKLPWEIKNGKM